MVMEFIEDQFKCRFWSNATWEMVIVDWPYGKEVKGSNPVKVDVWDLLEPNMPVITDIAWEYVKTKVTNLAKKDKKDE